MNVLCYQLKFLSEAVHLSLVNSDTPIVCLEEPDVYVTGVSPSGPAREASAT